MHSLLKRMKFVQRKATTSMSKLTMTNFEEQKREFLSDVATTVEMEEIPAELVLNWESGWSHPLPGRWREGANVV